MLLAQVFGRSQMRVFHGPFPPPWKLHNICGGMLLKAVEHG